MSRAILPSTKQARKYLLEEVIKQFPRQIPQEEAIKVSEPLTKITKFIVVTRDSSGLGFAKLLSEQEEGMKVVFSVKPKDEEEELDKLNKIGGGLINRIPFDELWKQRNDYKDWAFIWDGNFLSKEADQLRKEGFMVFGGHKLTDDMEHNRDFGLSLIKKAGLSQPEAQEFADIKQALDFLDQNDDRAFVFKPDEAKDGTAWVTTCPENDNNEKANREMYSFLASQKGEGSFILQERKKGIEVNVEMFLHKGQPFFAHANFESKRKYTGDLGKLVGCAQDVEFVIPLNCKILRDTLWKLVKLPEFSNYTGFLDLNLITADNQYFFLEFCARFGYNSHPNLFLNLAISPMSEIMSDFILGNTKNFGRHFRAGFGASITCTIDNPTAGLPITFDDEETEDNFYPFDMTKKGEDTFMAGYGNEVGIICSHDYDLESAADDCLRRFKKVHFSGKAGRTDLDKTNYKSNPIERLAACETMKLFDV